MADQTSRGLAVAPDPAPSDKTGSDPVSAPVETVLPPVDRSQQVSLDIYLRIRQVPEWARRAREVYPPVAGHTAHTLAEWDTIFRDF